MMTHPAARVLAEVDATGLPASQLSKKAEQVSVDAHRHENIDLKHQQVGDNL
jgi:hypothetical protein